MSRPASDPSLFDNLLAISCSTLAGSVALHNKGEICQLLRAKPRMHNRFLLPMINRVLARAQLKINQLDALVCDVGPGALMGTRLGVAAAQSLAYAADLPVFAVSSLQALAYQGQKRIPDTVGSCALLPMLDARLDQIYWACYQWTRPGSMSTYQLSSSKARAELPTQIHPASLANPPDINPAMLPPDIKTLLGLGDGWNYQPHFAAAMPRPDLLYPDAYPQAQDLIGWVKNCVGIKPLAADQLQPIYLRRAV